MKTSLKWTVLLMVFCSVMYGATITGVVTDAVTGDPLPGTNVVIQGSNHGAASDLQGEFVITGIKAGNVTLVFRYIGYEDKMIDLTLLPNDAKALDVELDHKTLVGEEVVISAQAAGQTAAINQQLQAHSVKNIVSAQRIQEIPEANAAGAVGRLPGVSLKGSSVVVRGLSPHYNKIQIDGIDMASTSFTDRSSSLGMISQYMLDGIEMTKTAMADQEADVLGATVNLQIREAPEAPTLNVLAQSGYNTLSETIGNQKAVLAASRRFFNNKFGVFGQVNFENNHGASHQMNSGYSRVTEGVAMHMMSLKDNDYKLNGRLGGSLVMDYKTPLTKIKFSNFYSQSSNENKSRSAMYRKEGERESHSLNLDKQELSVMTNALRVEHVLGRFELDAGINYSYSNRKVPENIDAQGDDISALNDSADWRGDPRNLPSYSTFNLNDAFIQSFEYSTRDMHSSKLAADFNVKTDIAVNNWLHARLKSGVKYRHQEKKYDRQEFKAEPMQAYFEQARIYATRDIDWLPEDAYSREGTIAYRYFLDHNYNNTNLLLGDYELTQMLSEARVREFHNWLLANPHGLAVGEGKPYYRDWANCYHYDYNGNEDYFGAYLMPTITFGDNRLTLIPGVRYEQNKTEYTGFRIPYLGVDGRVKQHAYLADYDTTRTRQNDFILPMLHAIYRPAKWLTLKSSYTHTLSRPQFSNIIPSWTVQQGSIDWNNPYLEPSLSKNIDLHLSAHSHKLGLLTVGGFHKSIQGLIFKHGETAIYKDDLESGFYDGLENPDNRAVMQQVEGFRVNYEINNPRPTYMYGFEAEWQSNFWFLPGVLKGLVVNVNYSRFFSEAKYPKVTRELDFATFKYTFTDTFYVDRVIDQADHILNLMVGFDYKKFSIRGSMKYTDGLFSKNSEEPLLREFTDERFDYDISITQGLPVRGLGVFANITNLGMSKYVIVNKGSGYPVLERYSDLGFALGLRYRL